MTAQQIQSHAPTAWQNYLKFVVVRNPWDHAISYYYWRRKRAQAATVSLKEYLRRIADPTREDKEHIRPPNPFGWQIYTIDDEVVVDHILRFENLSQDLEAVGNILGLDVALATRAKDSTRDKSKTLAEHYDSESIELVRSIYQKEIDYFGYTVPF